MARELAVIQSPVECCAPVAAPTVSDAETVALSDVFKALADPARIRIVNLLANSRDPICVCDLTAPTGLSQPTVSFHLKKLLSAGLVSREKRGTWSYYSLERKALARASAVLDPEGVPT
jgi:ArsR family transcriptional regulator